MDTIFMNLKNSQTSKLHVLILKFTNKLDLRRGENRMALSNLSLYCTWRNIKTHIITINLKYLLHHVMINLNYLMDHSLYQIFDYFEYILKKTWGKY